MALFKVAARDGSAEMIVRAKCLTCARQIAVDNRGETSTELWRNPELSTVELLRPEDKVGLIMKVVNA